MDAIQVLLNRVSVGKLKDPAPSEAQRNTMFRAALRAADHGCLKPWRFLTIEGEAMDQLGSLFLKAAQTLDPDLSEAQSSKYLNMPKRAPLIVVAIARNIDHPKVPPLEQEMATAAAVQNMITAAFAQGVGAYWRTGPLAENPIVKEGLGLSTEETLVGFIYLGTPAITPKTAPTSDIENFFKPWQGSYCQG
ncbi:nitroreductase family protein [Thalassolituus sp.]|uniref:nitroreductase family protein n=1 Tax=Thalassolituus sp. TaxID=2030822 RepID=UPI0026143A24|nr:nitroreductase family protein [Thalassolituus sp.]